MYADNTVNSRYHSPSRKKRVVSYYDDAPAGYDKWPDEYPPVELILNEWWSTTKVAQLKTVTYETIRRACAERRIYSRKIGDNWYIDPHSARAYQPIQRDK